MQKIIDIRNTVSKIYNSDEISQIAIVECNRNSDEITGKIIIQFKDGSSAITDAINSEETHVLYLKTVEGIEVVGEEEDGCFIEEYYSVHRDKYPRDFANLINQFRMPTDK